MVELRDQNLRKAQDSFGRFETIITYPTIGAAGSGISRLPLSLCANIAETLRPLKLV